VNGLRSKLIRFHPGEVPKRRAGTTRASPRALDIEAERMAESFRTLRTQVLVRTRQGARSFLVASARPQEGKSTIAAKLAATLAGGGRRVLVVDGDLRRPSLHRLFGVPNGIGLSELLTGDAIVVDGCQPVSPDLSVLTSGMLPRDPQLLLLSPALESVIGSLERAFDVVMVDSPPVLSAEDAVLLGAQLDGAILVLRAGSVTTSEARLVQDRLQAGGATVIGCVLNRFTGPASETYHPYAYVEGTE
jgi:capsular exopolysaccharide synthesis family protein